jgi:hypothetical protein
MKENYYGFNFKSIPKEVIPFKGVLEEGDVIYNTFRKELIWYKNEYKLLTDDAYDYLSNEDIRSNWQKYDAKNN